MMGGGTVAAGAIALDPASHGVVVQGPAASRRIARCGSSATRCAADGTG
jgi:hypothetical protein